MYRFIQSNLDYVFFCGLKVSAPVVLSGTSNNHPFSVFCVCTVLSFRVVECLYIGLVLEDMLTSSTTSFSSVQTLTSMQLMMLVEVIAT